MSNNCRVLNCIAGKTRYIEKAIGELEGKIENLDTCWFVETANTANGPVTSGPLKVSNNETVRLVGDVTVNEGSVIVDFSNLGISGPTGPTGPAGDPNCEYSKFDLVGNSPTVTYLTLPANSLNDGDSVTLDFVLVLRDLGLLTINFNVNNGVDNATAPFTAGVIISNTSGRVTYTRSFQVRTATSSALALSSLTTNVCVNEA